MKFVLLLAVLAVAVAWVLLRGRSRKAPPPARPADQRADAMLACAHCGVHLPQGEAAFDAAGRAYCTPEHRIAGPR